MKLLLWVLASVTAAFLSGQCVAAQAADPATNQSVQIGERLTYEISWRIPQDLNKPVQSEETINLTLSDPRKAVILDFQQPEQNVLEVQADEQRHRLGRLVRQLHPRHYSLGFSVGGRNLAAFKRCPGRARPGRRGCVHCAGTICPPDGWPTCSSSLGHPSCGSAPARSGRRTDSGRIDLCAWAHSRTRSGRVQFLAPSLFVWPRRLTCT